MEGFDVGNLDDVLAAPAFEDALFEAPPPEDLSMLEQMQARVAEITSPDSTVRQVLSVLRDEFGDEYVDRYKAELKAKAIEVSMTQLQPQPEEEPRGKKKLRKRREHAPAAIEALFEGLEEEGGNNGEEEDGDEDEDEENGKRKKNRKRERKQKQGKKKKSAAARAAGESQGEGEGDALPAPARAISAAEKVFRDASDAVRGRKQRGVIVPGQAQEEGVAEAAALVSDMQLAAERDREANEAGQPALARASLLPKVQAAVGKAFLSEPLVEARFLSALASWLSPLPDGSGPSIGLRSGALGCLLALRVDWSEGTALSMLKESGLGRAVLAMASTDDVPAIRRAAASLVEAWARPVFHINEDWSTLQQAERELRTRGPSSAAPATANASGKAAIAAMAARQQEDISRRVEARRNKPNTRARLFMGGVIGSEGEILHRPQAQQRKSEGSSAQSSQAVLAGIHYQEEMAKAVARASGLK